MSNPDPDLTELLGRYEAGDRRALDEMLPFVYDRIRAIAESQLAGERSDHTLQATALANEAYIRLIGQHGTKWRSRAHFFAIAARAIRRLLIDHARTKGRRKRGGGAKRLPLEEALDVSHADRTDLIALEDALVALAAEEPQAAAVVEMRFYGGMSNEEAARVLDVSTRTVERHWRFARAWLYRRLVGETGSDGDAA